MSKEAKFVRVPGEDVEIVWKVDPGSPAKDRSNVVLNPGDESALLDDGGWNLLYSHTRVKQRTVTIHVRGGVAYEPARYPSHVRVNIVDHDNENDGAEGDRPWSGR